MMGKSKGKVDNTANQIVMHFPKGVRGLGGFLILVGAGFLYGVLTLMGKEMVLPIVFLCLGLPALLGGIWIMGYTFRLIFDHTLGDMTIRTGVGPFIYRTRHILGKQVQSVRAFVSEEGPYVIVWAVSLKMAGRKKDMKIIDTVDESRANYIASRIMAFLEQHQKISKD